LRTQKQTDLKMKRNKLKHLTVLISTLISFAINAQPSEGEDLEKTFKKILIGFNISPDYCKMKYNSQNEVMNIGITSGIQIRYNFSNQFGFESGLQYSNKKYGHETNGLTFGDLIDPINGFYNSSMIGISNSTCSYDDTYFDVPFRTIYSFGENRVRLIASIGIAANIMLRSQTNCLIQYENGEQETKIFNRNEPRLNLSTTFSIGVEFKINKRIKLQVEPTYRYGIRNISNSLAEIKFWNLGLNTTCYIALK